MLLPADLRNRSRAGTDRAAVDVDGASAAQSGTTAKFCAGQAQRVAQDPEQRSFGRNADFFFTAVDAECEIGHVGEF